MRIAITGVPGAGKHSVGKALSEKLNYDFIDLGALAISCGFTSPNSERDTRKVDLERLKEELKERDNCIMVSSYSELIPNDVVIVIRCDPRILFHRLKEKKYSEEKIRENLEAECLDYCLISSLNKNPKNRVYEIDNSGELANSIETALRIVGGKERPVHGRYDYSEYVDDIDSIMHYE